MTKIVTDSPEELALLKQQGEMWDSLEQLLVPKQSRTLFCVIGFTGRKELGTRRTWLVRAERSESEANTYANACQKHANEWEKLRKSYTSSPPFGWSQLDPKMIMSHEGTRYRVEAIPIRLRPEDYTQDECAICGANIIQLSEDLFVCEEGHDVE